MGERHAVVVGAGIGGLAAALDLAVAGWRVTVVERQEAPGGKMRRVQAGGALVDAGPTVFTMRWVFERLFAAAGADLAAELRLERAEVLARHAWAEGGRLDLFADFERSVDAIGVFAGAAEAAGFRAFTARARRIYETLEQPFLCRDLPTPLSLTREAGVGRMLTINPFDTMMRALGSHFGDVRLRQLFGRYATYCGSSPYQAPATLMLVAHVERDGVWRVAGGMHAVAACVARLAKARGAEIRYGTAVEGIDVVRKRASGVRLAGGERIEADAVVVNADASALGALCFGRDVAGAVPAMKAGQRSLSAVTWAMNARVRGLPMVHHNVFFSRGLSGGVCRCVRARAAARRADSICVRAGSWRHG